MDSLQPMEESARDIDSFTLWRAPHLDVRVFDRRKGKELPSRGTRGDVPLSTPVFHVERDAKRVWVATDLPPNMTHEDALGAAINRIVAPGFPLPIAAVLRSCISAASDETGASQQDQHAHASNSNATALGLARSARPDFRRGVPGQPLHPYDSSLLQMRPLRPFHDLELCAVQKPGDGDGGLVYGEVRDTPVSTNQSA